MGVSVEAFRKGVREEIDEFFRLAETDEELAETERKLRLYPTWRRALRLMDSFFEAPTGDSCAERVDGGTSPLPHAQHVVERKESHPEYRRISRNVAAVEKGLAALSGRERQFATLFWLAEHSRGDHLQLVADELGWGRTTVREWRKTCLRKMLFALAEADTILIRARWAEEIAPEGR